MATAGSAKSHLRKAIEAFAATLASDSRLLRLLRERIIEDQLHAFDLADAIAVKKQRLYRRAGRLALWSMTVSVVSGALVLMPLDTVLVGRSYQAISVVQTVALTTAVLTVLWIAWTRPIDQWMQARAEAETIRGDVFRSILEGSDQGGDPKRALQEKLACFRRAQLESQLEFYDRRGSEARQACGRATPLRLVGYALTGIVVAFGFAAFVKAWSDFGLPMWWPLLVVADWILVPNSNRWQLGLGTVASSVLAFASARSLMDQDERNAICYGVAAEQIREVVRADVATAVTAAANGDSKTVGAFCGRIQRILEAENLAWLYARPPDDPRYQIG